MDKAYAIITGASSGIGLEFANQLAEKGYNLLIIARRRAELDKLSKELIERNKIKCIPFSCDLSKDQEIDRAIRKISTIKNIEYLINCAGFGNQDNFQGMDEKQMKDMITVHIFATTRLTKSILPIMIKRNKGKIINVSSIASFITTSKSNAIYNSTKAYIRAFTETLIDETKTNKESMIHIQALCPGFTKTNFFKHYNASFVPRVFWMETDRVVRRSLRKVEKRSSVYIPGFKNKFLVWLLKSWIIGRMFNFAARKSNIE